MERNTGDNELNPQEGENPKEDDLYNQMATEEPERDVEISLPKGGGGSAPQSLTDAEMSPNTTDLQATLQRLFPQFKHKIIDKVAQAAMVARISPDVFLDMIYLTVTSIVEQMDAESEDLDVQEIIDLVYFAFSIGLEGKGRLDAINICGVAREQQELEQVSRSLGLN